MRKFLPNQSFLTALGLSCLFFIPTVDAQTSAVPPTASETIATSSISVADTPPRLSPVSDLLGWVEAPQANLCQGYFLEPEEISKVPIPAPLDSTEMTITADSPTFFMETGIASLEGNVEVTQPGREIKADKAIIYRNPQTGKVAKIELIGDVSYQEHQRKAMGQRAVLNLEEKTAEVEEGVYRFVQPSRQGDLNAWGTTSQLYRQSSGIVNLKNATYTTCRPISPAWHIKAGSLKLDRESGRGVAKHSWFYAKNIPVAYMPYFNFPLDKRRYTGFLYPTFTYSNSAGFDVGVPYYLNLAPNYDETITPRLMTERGVQFNSLTRYLTTTSNGVLILSYLPSDAAFRKFKQNAPLEYPNDATYDPYLSRIESASDNRGLFEFKDLTVFNQNWSTSLDLNYVTDDYYFDNLTNTPNTVNTDQLLNQWDINYQSEHWRFLNRVQMYQTLHLINEPFILDQYQRLPQTDLSADYPELIGKLNFHLDSEVVNFQHEKDFFNGTHYPIGFRGHLAPSINLPLMTASSYITPALQLDVARYDLDFNNALTRESLNPNIPRPQPAFNDNIDTTPGITRVLPLFNIDSGLYFERKFHLAKTNYKQTLEPRLYYLYVPDKNQNDIPAFDTTLPPFDFSELYRNNRFIGYDRIGDANQLSMGVTSRLLDDYNGLEKVNMSIGAIYYFRKHSVCLYPGCTDDPTINDKVSPIAGQLTYNLNPAWSAIGNIAWDPNQGEVNNDGVRIQYMPAPQHIVSLGYQYIQGGDVINTNDLNSSQNNFNRVDLGLSWPVFKQWNAVANWNYNISHNHPQAYLYGLEYDSCCWSLRVVASTTLISENSDAQPGYQNAYFVQILLKGLGTIGNSNAGSTLMSRIPGYQDYFRG